MKNAPLKVFAGVVMLVVFVVFAAQVWEVTQTEGRWLNTLAPQGSNAQTVQSLVAPVFWIAGVIFVLVIGVCLYIAWRFRDRGDDETADEVPSQLHGNSTLEIAWTAIPAAILLVVAVLTVKTLVDLDQKATDALHVKVEGQQWWWSYKIDLSNGGAGNGSYDDPEDVSTATELVIPTGREVLLDVTSNDVIHSFWIPALNGKKDAVPGMDTHWKIQADKPGVYRGQCTEFCGLSHANMRMLVRAVSPEYFANTWVPNQLRNAAEPAPGSKEAAGKDVFSSQLCSSCHLIRGVNDDKVKDPAKGAKSLLVSGVAPDLTHFASRGTFGGSIFNSHYPNPSSKVEGDQPFGQTCRVTGAPLAGESPDLPLCGIANYTPGGLPDIPYGVAEPGNPDNPANSVSLEDWLRDPPKMKPMAADKELEACDAEQDDAAREACIAGGGKYRGMPNLKLSQDQIDLLVAYLNSLK